MYNVLHMSKEFNTQQPPAPEARKRTETIVAGIDTKHGDEARAAEVRALQDMAQKGELEDAAKQFAIREHIARANPDGVNRVLSMTDGKMPENAYKGFSAEQLLNYSIQEVDEVDRNPGTAPLNPDEFARKPLSDSGKNEKAA